MYWILGLDLWIELLDWIGLVDWTYGWLILLETALFNVKWSKLKQIKSSIVWESKSKSSVHESSPRVQFSPHFSQSAIQPKKPKSPIQFKSQIQFTFYTKCTIQSKNPRVQSRPHFTLCHLKGLFVSVTNLISWHLIY